MLLSLFYRSVFQILAINSFRERDLDVNLMPLQETSQVTVKKSNKQGV